MSDNFKIQKKEPVRPIKGHVKYNLFTVLMGVCVFLVIVAVVSSSSKNTSSIPSSKEVVKEEFKTPEEQITLQVRKKLDGKNNMGWPYEEKIEVTKNLDNTYNVEVLFNSDDNLGKSLIKMGVQLKTAEIMTALFTERNDVQNVIVYALFPLQDKYGNAERGAVYVAELNILEAKKVNWGIDPNTLALNILPNIYKVSYPNRIF